MNAIPCFASAADRQRQYEEAAQAARNEYIERRTPELKAEYRADLEVIADNANDVMFYRTGHSANNPSVLRILELIRDGDDDTELGHLFRMATIAAVDDAAEQRAESELEDQA
jgi:hypothetical protein